MPTKLKQPLKRTLEISGIRRPLTIVIDPDTQTITMREKSRRQSYSLPLYTVYNLAVRAYLHEQEKQYK